MDTTTDESEIRSSSHRRFRYAITACLVVFGLPILYVLLSGPLLWYSVHYPGASRARLVDVYMQPLLWADLSLTPEFEAIEGEYNQPLPTKILYWYYGLWGYDVEDEFTYLKFERLLGSLPNPDREFQYP